MTWERFVRRPPGRERRAEIQRLWLEGRTLREIAAAVDSTPNSINVEIVRMRKAGYDLPYRRARTA